MRLFISIMTVTLATLVPTLASAHAHLDHASPAVGATVPAAPREVTIWFTQSLEPAFSTVAVTDTAGTRVDEGKPRISGKTMSISLKAFGGGVYHVHWHAVSVDTHTTQGDFSFTVAH